LKPEQLEDGITKLFALFALFRASTAFLLFNEFIFGYKLERSIKDEAKEAMKTQEDDDLTS
jgi:hypothetical protein